MEAGKLSNTPVRNAPVRFVRNAMEDIGMITALDETLNHQIVDTFASVSTSEHSWTEKIWTALVRKDGAMGIDFGLGRYHNRGVMDGWGAVSRGAEQWTVRANRELRDDPMVTEVGPLTYEIIEPLRQVRYALARNDIQPIAYDITFTAEMPHSSRTGTSSARRTAFASARTSCAITRSAFPQAGSRSRASGSRSGPRNGPNTATIPGASASMSAHITPTSAPLPISAPPSSARASS